jgi:quinol-cytochrome oxidoreductase complex cytochrome b subunit
MESDRGSRTEGEETRGETPEAAGSPGSPGSGRRKGLLSWLAEATDARILVIPRLLGLIYGDIDDRLSLREAWRAAMRRRLPANVGWKHAFGGATYFLCMILVVTGVMLAFFYRPSTVEAYPSLQYLETEVPFGWLVRHAHFWSAGLVVLAALIHLFRVLYTGTYRAPRQTTWLMGVLLLLTLLAFVTSGYLLPWDQWAYWTTTMGLEDLERFPLVGGLMARVFRVDEFVSGATLSRFYATHVILLPWVLLLLLSLHFQLVRKHGVALDEGVASGEAKEAAEGEPFFPNHMLRQLVAVFVTLGAVVTLSAFWPRPFGGQADPFVPAADLPALGLPGAILLGAHRLPMGLGLVGLPLLLLMLVVLPLVERSGEGPFYRRPLAMGAFALLLLFLVASLVAGLSPESAGALSGGTG